MTDEKEKPKSELTFNKKQVPPESLRKIVWLTTKLSQKIKVLFASCLPMDFLPFSLFFQKQTAYHSSYLLLHNKSPHYLLA